MPDARVVLITGGGRGIGRACAQRFAEEGWACVILDVDASASAVSCQSLEEMGAKVLYYEGDVAQETDCREAAKMALREFRRIDALIANAGVRVFGTVLDSTEDDWDQVVGVNLKGTVYSCKAVLPTMVRQQHGALVLVSSTHARVGRADMPLYDATKSALLSITRSLAVGYGRDGIRCNALCPGRTLTHFHESQAISRGQTIEELRSEQQDYALLGRAAEPEDVAAAAYFLASEDSRMITGQALAVDGGLSAGSLHR